MMGVCFSFKEYIQEETEIIDIGRLRILHTTISLEDKKSLEISSLYRSHDLPKCEFVSNLNNFLKSKKNCKNHLIAGDFNLDITNLDNLNNEHLQNLLEKGYTPSFQTITRPSTSDPTVGSCIDNIYRKIKTITSKALKIDIPFNDHYPLILELGKNRKTKLKPEKIKFINYNKLHKVASDSNWSQILSMHGPNHK